MNTGGLETLVKDVRRRMDHLRRTSVRLRMGDVTAVSPLSITLGNSTTTYDSVRCVGASPAVGDRVAVLCWGNDLLVLGAITYGSSSPGDIVAKARQKEPAGWLLCDGRSLLRTTYPSLFNAMKGTFTATSVGTAIITSPSSDAQYAPVGALVEGAGVPAGTTITVNNYPTNLTLSAAVTSGSGITITVLPYGAADSTHFYIPGLRGRAPIGSDWGSGGLAGRVTVARYLGQVGGEEFHTLVTGEIPAHHHTMAERSNVAATGAAKAANDGTGAGGPQQTDNTGGGAAHYNMVPYQMVNYFIKT